MNAPEALVPFAVLALAGSAHCAGMCGGFALTVGAGGRGRLSRMGAYALGKALAYATLGVATQLAAHRLLHGAPSAGTFDGGRRVLAWIAGLTLVAGGLGAMGLGARAGRVLPHRLRAGLQRTWTGLLSLPSTLRGFSIGFLNGFLPCGLTWSALAISTQVDAQTAAVGMFLFGLGTAPVLGAVGLAGWKLPLRVRRVARLVLGPALVAFGVATALRGGLPFGGASATCCADPVAALQQRDRDHLQHADQDSQHAAEDLDRAQLARGDLEHE